MPYINCCNQKRSCDVFRLENLPGLLLNYAYFIEACPSCGHTVLLLKRYLPDGEVSEVRKSNEAARKLFEKFVHVYFLKWAKLSQSKVVSHFCVTTILEL